MLCIRSGHGYMHKFYCSCWYSMIAGYPAAQGGSSGYFAAIPKGRGAPRAVRRQALHVLLQGQSPGFYVVGTSILALLFGILFLADKAINTAERFIALRRRLKKDRREDQL